MLNRIILQGRCGSDPELRSTPAGVDVATVNLAVDRDRKNKEGNTETDWITVVAWRETAKFLNTYFSKGRMAIVSGRLQMRSWVDKDGNKRTTAEVLAEHIYFGDSKRDNTAPAGDPAALESFANRAADMGIDIEFTEVASDDLPFN